jgi:two-component system sensor histidine kinase KdpD
VKFLSYTGGVNMASDRPDPDRLLAKLKAKEEREARTRGRLRIYLAAAPGAGKTYAMLGEGRRRKERGTDVVIGYVEPHNRPLTINMAEGLEVVPRRVLEYRGKQMEEMDVDAVIARRPRVALVDELAHTNVPGSRHEKRWQDVLAIRDAGIIVITTVNVQHLESLRDRVEQITGITVRETVPDWVIDAADEVEMVDIAPEALQSRMRHGNIYPPERAQTALQSFFRIGNLQALRDMALRRTMQEVDGQLEQYMREHDLDDWRPEERVLICFDHRQISDTLLRRAARMARGMQAQLFALYIKDDEAEKARAALDAHVKLAESLEAEVVQAEAEDPVAAIARFVAEHRITQVVIGHTQRSRWHELLHGSIVNRLLRALPDTDVHVITARPGESRQ